MSSRKFLIFTIIVVLATLLGSSEARKKCKCPTFNDSNLREYKKELEHLGIYRDFSNIKLRRQTKRDTSRNIQKIFLTEKSKKYKTVLKKHGEAGVLALNTFRLAEWYAKVAKSLKNQPFNCNPKPTTATKSQCNPFSVDSSCVQNLQNDAYQLVNTLLGKLETKSKTRCILKKCFRRESKLKGVKTGAGSSCAIFNPKFRQNVRTAASATSHFYAS